TWQTVPGGSVAGNDKVWRKVSFPEVTTDRIRVRINNALYGRSRIVEVEAFGVAVPTPPPTRVNVAAATNGATASASSEYNPDFSAQGAINGDHLGLAWEQGGGWADATPNSYPDWLQVNFSGVKTINEVDLYTLQDNYSSPTEPTEATTANSLGVLDFEVQYWDGASWQIVPGAGVVGNDRVWRKFTFSEITTDRIRVFVTRSRPSFSRIVELEAYQSSQTPQPAVKTNVAAATNGATASASSVIAPGFSPQGTINGDRRGLNWEQGGGWADATPNAYADWLQVDFAGTKTISEIDVFTLQDNYSNPAEPTEAMLSTTLGLLDFEVQYWDGTAWQTVPGGSVVGNDKVWRKFTFPEVATTRIRVYVTNSRPSFSRIVEVEAY
ncbi:MAG TPA: discoidin domain-containing protein, partial [Pyrinomonadaceae bacterium]|nr:discoidin domain-containing protein [Pyrinomonadaceae bacterium]